MTKPRLNDLSAPNSISFSSPLKLRGTPKIQLWLNNTYIRLMLHAPRSTCKWVTGPLATAEKRVWENLKKNGFFSGLITAECGPFQKKILKFAICNWTGTEMNQPSHYTDARHCWNDEMKHATALVISASESHKIKYHNTKGCTLGHVERETQ